MNAREMYNAINTGNREAQQQVSFELMSLVQTLSTAVLVLAGSWELRTGHNPLEQHQQTILRDFLELPRETE